MTQDQLTWLAGWLEGEGSFSLSSGTVSVHAGSTDLDVLTKVAALLGTEKIAKKKPTAYTRRQFYTCRVFGEKAATSMTTILPFMGERRSGRIRELLAHHANRSVRRSAAGIRRWANPEFKKRTSDAISAAKIGQPKTREAALRGWETRRKGTQAAPEMVVETQPVAALV